MNFIRSLLFSIYFILTTFLLGFLIFPNLLKKDKKEAFDQLGKFWTKAVLWGLKHITKIDWKIKGLENMPENGICVIAGKHESTWETLVLHATLKTTPAFVLKKELLNVPIFGQALAYTNNIAIDRNGSADALKLVMKKAKEAMERGHSVVIFPQGTRVPVHATTEKYPYKTGIIGLVKYLKADVVPMVLNSGMYWSKRQFIKKPGTIKMEFLKPIKYEDIEKYSKKDFMNLLENTIESGSKKLITK